MQKLNRIMAIIGKDLMESLRNKTILIVIMLPLAASLLFTIIDNTQMQKDFEIGIVKGETGKLVNFISSNVQNFTVHEIVDVRKGKLAVENGKIEALIVRKTGNTKADFTVYIDKQQPVTYLFLKDGIEEILQRYLQIDPGFNMQVIPVNTAGAEVSFLPIWITITITMIGVLVIAGNLAEEKDDKTLDAVLISPAGAREVLIAKGCFGILLSTLTVILMLILNGVFPGGVKGILLCLVILMGSFNFTAIGLLIGSVADSQSAARSIGTAVYFPLLFPTLIHNLSDFTRRLAGLFPTYYLYKGLEKGLFYGGAYSEIWSDILILICYSILLAVITYFTFKKIIINK